MTHRQKKTIAAAAIFCAAFAVTPTARAMHIMEGYLPAQYCIAWGIISFPFLLTGFFRIRKIFGENRKALPLLAASGAFIFVISSLKIPSVTGSCSHMTGTGLGAILFGPCIVSILGTIVLLFQAVLLAHGGLTTLGANTFSMAVAGPFLSYGVFLLCRRLKAGHMMTVFLAAFSGDLFTYCITSLQLAVAYPSEVGGVAVSFGKFLSVFAPTQLPLSIVEGLVTAAAVLCLENYAKPELRSTGYFREVS